MLQLKTPLTALRYMCIYLMSPTLLKVTQVAPITLQMSCNSRSRFQRLHSPPPCALASRLALPAFHMALLPDSAGVSDDSAGLILLPPKGCCLPPLSPMPALPIPFPILSSSLSTLLT